jgi:ATP-dependent Clp protease protease subunit
MNFMNEEKESKSEVNNSIQAKIIESQLKRGMISVNDAFDNKLSEKIISLIDYLVYVEDRKDLIIQINSPGGVITDGLAIYDKIRSVAPLCNVHTAVTGVAASMGAALLCMGTMGYRYAYEHSTIMIHQPLSGYYNGMKINDYRQSVKKTKEVEQTMIKILAGRSKISEEEMRRACDRDNYLNAQEALELGLIDKIITELPEVFFDKK